MRIVTPQPVAQGGLTRSTTATFVGSNGLIQSAAINTARFTYNPVTLAPIGLLLEGARTNLLTGSADFTATYWATATNVVVTADNTTSPDGTSNADRLADNTTTNVAHSISRNYTFTAGAHTLSVYVKRNDHRWFRLLCFDGTTNFYANFDLLNGVVGNKHASATSTITAAGNGWFRCTLTATTVAAAGSAQIVMLASNATDVPSTYTGTGTTLWLFGAQLEAASTASSYIPTTTTALLRGADALTQSGLIFSNVPISETLWTAGTYTTGTQRYEGITLYEVIASPSTTDQPSVGAAKTVPTWRIVGAINRYKMFDNVISSQSSNTGSVAVSIYPAQIVNAVAFFGLAGNSINVIMTDPIEGQVYNQTKTLQDNTLISDWYAYFFESIYPLTDAVFTDLPSYLNANISVTINAGASTARCGEMVIGRQSNLGLANFGTSVSIQDYSIKTTDDFGNIVIQERAYSKRADYDVTVESNRVATVQKLLADIRTTPTVFIGEDDRPETVVYGFYKSFNIVIATPSISDCSIEVEGLI
jgi:hypothetical protein